MNIKKILVGVSAGALLLASTAMPVLAAGKAAPKTTGGVGYTAYTTTQRHAEFNAIETTNICSSAWDVTGTYVINVEYLSVNYPETLILTQSGTGITGVSLDTIPAGSYFTVTGGSVIGNVINIDANQGSLVVHMSDTIANDGSMTGSWADETPGTRTGTWASTSGAATQSVTGCTGKGVFNYSDADGNFYKVDVQYVNVSGHQAWFAGPVVSGNVGAGKWLFAKVLDGGEPSIGVDQIWGSFTTEAAAKVGVASMSNPGDGFFAITSGNLQVH